MRSSALGFGCAPVLGAVSGRVADRAIGVALDLGVNYFDVAPSYGYGAAEAWLGRRLAGRRDQVVLATKFGIEATSSARVLAPVKPVVRVLRSVLRAKPAANPAFTTTISGSAFSSRFHRRLPIEAAALRGSVQRSLRALRTDHLDLLFLHEPHETISAIDEVIAEMERMKTQGLVRGWGIAYMRSQAQLHQRYLSRCDVRQFDLSPVANDYSEVAWQRGEAPNVIFSPYANLPRQKRTPAVLSDLFTGFPKSVVLCSMFNPEHIRSNVLSCV